MTDDITPTPTPSAPAAPAAPAAPTEKPATPEPAADVVDQADQADQADDVDEQLEQPAAQYTGPDPHTHSPGYGVVGKFVDALSTDPLEQFEAGQ